MHATDIANMGQVNHYFYSNKYAQICYIQVIVLIAPTAQGEKSGTQLQTINDSEKMFKKKLCHIWS